MEFDVNFADLSAKDKDAYEILDIRNEESFEYGHVPGAKNMPFASLDENLSKLSASKEYYVYCRSGNTSPEAVQKMREQGYNAYNLVGGYFGWLKDNMQGFEKGTKAHDVEESIRKKFHKQLFTKFCQAINQYELLKPGDKVAVCISGGKDSMLMAKLFQELKRHNKFEFDLVFLVMNPGYSPENQEIIEKNAQLLGVPITIFETDIFQSVFNIEKSPCYICARMRRGHLYSKAKELGCNKIALGHHYDDVIETIVMGMLYGAQIQTMMPKIHSTNFEGMELIRPMYFIREADIIKWRDYNGLRFIQCACKFTENCNSEGCEIGVIGSKRKKVKSLIAALKKDDPQIEYNIFASMENVNLSTVLAYKDKDGVRHEFNDEYDKK